MMSRYHRAADNQIAFVESADHVVAGADVKHKVIGPEPELIIIGPPFSVSVPP
jgi:hypothetical protein